MTGNPDARRALNEVFGGDSTGFSWPEAGGPGAGELTYDREEAAARAAGDELAAATPVVEFDAVVPAGVGLGHAVAARAQQLGGM